MKIWIRFFSCLLIACLWLTAQAQNKSPQKQKPPDEETLRIETELVQIEVVVTDKQGKIVRDLKREDFELKEDGKPQEISYYSMGTSTRPAQRLNAEAKPKNKAVATSTVPVTTVETGPGRNMILAIDDVHLAFSNLTYAKQALLKFVDQQMASEDRVALITTSGQLGLYQQFTSDHEALKRAINRLTLRERNIATIASDVPRITPYQAELIDSRDPDALAIAVNEIMRQFPNTPRSSAVSQAETKARQIVAENTSITKATLSTLENIIRSLRTLPGRKSLVLVSDGFLLGGTNQGTQDEVRRITDAATRSGVIIYAIDARGLVAATAEFDASQPGFGLETPPGVRSRIESGAIEANRDGLNALSRDTGGFPVFNNNDLSLGLQKILDDTELYYLLAFEPVVSYRDGRFRKLEVRVKNHPEYKIRSSKGYFAPDDKAVAKAADKEEKDKVKLAAEREKNPEKAAKKETAAQMTIVRDVLGSLFPLRQIPVEMSVDFIDSGNGEGFAAITSHLDIAGVKFDLANDRYNATLEVIGVIYDEKGNVADNFSEKVGMTLKPATYERTKKSGLVYTRRVKLKPGFYQVRLAVLKETPRQNGSASEWVEISDLSRKQLALSSIFLATKLETLNAAAAPNEKPGSEKKIAEEEETAKPTQIARRFKRGSSFDFTVFAYNAKSDANGQIDLVLQSQVFSGNKVVFATPLSKMSLPAEDKSGLFVPYAARVSLETFEPGKYELRLVVIDRVTKTSARRKINFVIE